MISLSPDVCLYAFWPQTSSSALFRSRLLCGTSSNRWEGSGWTRPRFRRCAASACSTRRLCLRSRKYDSRYSRVSLTVDPLFWSFSSKGAHRDSTPLSLSLCAVSSCRSDAPRWPSAQTVGLHLWAGSSGGPQALHGVSEQRHRRVQAAPGDAHALLRLLTAPHHVRSVTLSCWDAYYDF